MESSLPGKTGLVPMLLQTNSYVVPRDKREEHARLLRRFRQTLIRLGCDHFEVYEQTGPNWSSGDNSGRFVQIMRFRDRKQQLAVQNAERTDPAAQALLQEFCDLINLPYQQQHGLFAAGFYNSFMRMPDARHDKAAPHEPNAELPDQTQESPAIEAETGSDPIHLASADEAAPQPEASDTTEGEPGDIDSTAAFQADDDTDYSEQGPSAGFHPQQSDDPTHETENPTFPSNS
jgi:hypothetical protein